METQLTVTTEDGSTLCSLADFLRDNEDSADICEAVKALEPGASYDGGGGAGCWFTITKAAQ
jgi:hypothetical protein